MADVPLGDIALLPQLGGLIGMEAEEKHIFIPQHIVHLHVGAVQCADRQCAVHHELHVAGAAGLLTGGGDLLGDLAGGHQMLGKGYPVIFQKHHLQFAPAAGIVRDVVRQRVDQVDDPLGHRISRRGLGTKKEGVRPGDGVGVILQLLVKGDDMQHVQQLPLVFVEPLHLHIENGVGIQRDSLYFPGIGRKVNLVLPLDLVQTLENGRILPVGIQLFQGLRMEQIVVPAGEIPHQCIQTGIDLAEPAAVVDAVGDVGKFPRLHGAGVFEHIFFQDLGM